MNLNNIKNSLRKFFRGEETEEGRWLIDQWYRYFDNKSNELINYSDEEKEKLRQELWTDIQTSIDVTKESKVKQLYSERSRKYYWSVKIAVGFILVFLVLLPAVYYQSVFLQESQDVDLIEYRTVSNPAGQISKLTLADGSTIWLSAASTLRYPKQFGDSLRKVRLSGEAFFDVTNNPDKPFVVNSERLQTRVLGTSFNVRVFESEENIQVTVATGRVSVRQTATSKDSLVESTSPVAVLEPDQQFVFRKKTQKGITQTVKSTLYTSWKDGRLIFDNHSFEDIARRLERWYGVQIHFADVSLKQIRFKVTFENNSLKYALQMLQVIEDFKFTMEDDQVWIKPSS